VSGVSLIASMLLIWAAKDLWLLLLAAALWGFGSGAAQAVCQAEGLRRVTYARKGVASSTYYMFGDIGRMLGPMLGGVIAGMSGYGTVFLFMTIPAAMAMMVMFISDQRRKSVVKLQAAANADGSAAVPPESDLPNNG